MQGNIDFSGTLSGSIAGGGGGSEVTITPTFESGTKIADFTIGEISGAIYIPNVSAYETTSHAQSTYETKVDSQTKYENMGAYVLENFMPIYNAGRGINFDTEHKQIETSFNIANYQPKLTAGTGIDITGNVISCAASGSVWNYSTIEVDTGQKWIDGKEIYSKVMDLGSDVSFTVGWNSLVPHNNYYDTIIDGKALYSGGYMQSVGIAKNDTTNLELCAYYSMSARYIIIKYTKQ